MAATTAFGIAAGLCVAGGAATPAVADEPAATEIVVPDPGSYTPREDLLKHAGATGYAHTLQGTGTVWTDYATGTHTPIGAEQAAGHSGLSAAISGEPFDQPRTVTVSDLATKAQKTITLPGRHIWAKAYNADTAVSYTTDGSKVVSLSLWQAAAEGAPVERPVAELPAAITPLVVLEQDTKGALVRVKSADGVHVYLLDYATATLKRLPDVINPGNFLVLGDRHVVAHAPFGEQVFSVPRDNPAASPVTTPLPAATGTEGPGTLFTVVGDSLLFQRTLTYPHNDFERGNSVRAMPLGGGTVTELLWRAEEDGFVIAPDGSVLVAGGDRARDWAVRRITAGTGGAAPQVASVTKIPQFPATYRGLALGGGRLSYLADTESYGMTGLYDVDTTSVFPTTARLRTKAISPRPGLVSLGDGYTAYQEGNALYSPLTDTSMRRASLPGPGEVVDAAGRYALVRSGSTIWVADLENHHVSTPDVPLTLTDPAAALWDAKVWKPAAAVGQVNSYDLTTKATSAPVDLGSGCKPTELQAVGRWLYWACGAGKAGVHDLTLKKGVTVPTGEALLGDGFVVRHEGDKLRLTDAATGQTTDFADLPASASGSGRRATWTVDKFGGDVAYVDAQSRIHVRKVELPRQPMTALRSSVPPVLSFTDQVGLEPEVSWSPVWRFSRPVGPWRIEVKDRNGQIVHSTGGSVGDGAGVETKWNGTGAGRGLLDGDYTWSLRVLPVGGVAPGDERTLTGTVRLEGSSLTSDRGTYVPITPTRIMDTRSGLGVPQGKLGAGGWARLKVAGAAGLPSLTVASVVLNVTATNPTASSFVSVYPDGTPVTSASNLNFKAGRTVSNLVKVPVVNGYVDFYNKSGEVDLVADIAGYYSSRSGGSTYQPVTPRRLMDTRAGLGVPKAKVGAGGTVTLTVGTKYTALAMNVTATNPTASGFVSVYPYGTQRTSASNLNFTAGQTIPNLVVVPVKDGKITFYNHAGTVDLIADVAGYYTH
ncbi:hypothetical protein [Streptomyces sp. NPDC008121]|uniref:hypothetical protein n=1 Tax=Streptomyces sp. NPDC008121 TaxID=3364809 RepID=UPI0036F0E430